MSATPIPPRVVTTAEDITALSDGEAISFPDVVRRMMENGIERYHADLPRGDRVFYLPDGRSLLVAGRPEHTPVAANFSAEGVEQAVRAVQAGTIRYRAFCQQIAAAGCAGYLVTTSGRRAVYYGRTGETHVELFPGAA